MVGSSPFRDFWHCLYSFWQIDSVLVTSHALTDWPDCDIDMTYLNCYVVYVYNFSIKMTDTLMAKFAAEQKHHDQYYCDIVNIYFKPGIGRIQKFHLAVSTELSRRRK